jgi:FkbM family methyltransferase
MVREHLVNSDRLFCKYFDPELEYGNYKKIIDVTAKSSTMQGRFKSIIWADTIRFALLHNYGGSYIDADIALIANVQQTLRDNKVPEEKQHSIFNLVPHIPSDRTKSIPCDVFLLEDYAPRRGQQCMLANTVLLNFKPGEYVLERIMGMINETISASLTIQHNAFFLTAAVRKLWLEGHEDFAYISNFYINLGYKGTTIAMSNPRIVTKNAASVHLELETGDAVNMSLTHYMLCKYTRALGVISAPAGSCKEVLAHEPLPPQPTPPPQGNQPYTSTGRVLPPVQFYSQAHEDIALLACLLQGMKNGRYLEMGALDGQKFSNTLFLQEQMGWKGILIEADPTNFRNLAKRRPDDIKISTAICPEGQKSITFMGRGGPVSGAVDTMSEQFQKKWHKNAGDSDKYTVPCRTLTSVFEEHGVKHLDLFSLDVEGGELMTLQSMDWSVDVSIWLIELDGSSPAKDQGVRDLLISNGYVSALPQWDIRKFCKMLPKCTGNEVFFSKRFYSFFQSRYQEGKCGVERLSASKEIALAARAAE